MRGAGATRQLHHLARVDQVGIADLRIGRKQRVESDVVARRDARKRVAAAHRDFAATTATARQVHRLAGVDQVRIADLRIGREQVGDRQLVARRDTRERVAAAHRDRTGGRRR
ncbi:hypothetical protein GCM10007164_22740 [Luteimonas padinae]|nr:hypothetical protein GCM10007164_22740 [Luteimonas padinae]